MVLRLAVGGGGAGAVGCWVLALCWVAGAFSNRRRRRRGRERRLRKSITSSL